MNSPVKYVLSGTVVLIAVLLMVYYFYPRNTPRSHPENNVIGVQEEQTKEPNEPEIIIDADQSQRQLQQALRESRSTSPQGFT